MKVCLLVIGKTDAAYLKAGIEEYERRLKFYIPYEMKVIPDIKNARNLTENQQKEKEGELILGQLETSDIVVLLDEKGHEYTSKGFSEFLAQKMLVGTKRLVLLSGALWFSGNRYTRRHYAKISLSRMTYSHQMVRMIFVEQLYRAMTIQRGEPYHHE